MLRLAIIAAVLALTQAQWKPAYMNCTMVQQKQNCLDFSMDIRNDPAIFYKGSTKVETEISFFMNINGESWLKDSIKVPPCETGETNCVKFFMLSLKKDIKEQMLKAETKKLRLSINFKDTTANVLYVRTRLCGEFIWGASLGLWEALDRAYINSSVKMWNGDAEDEVKKLSDELKRKYFHSLAHLENSTSTVTSSKSRSRRSHHPRRLFDSNELESGY
ncbi:unnamed protein product, partial [Mesorhabditis belari]|uniref:Uncharacterized protein n=1 Tax=Mesorhabditis belari TaxID=2138241 RepID=A0AAF3EC58_9BILA